MSQLLGFIPRTVLDIGAFEGYWSRGIKEVFPTCHPFMIEGDKDKAEKLESTGHPFEIALLADKEKSVTFHKTKGVYTTGNSIYIENSLSFANGNPTYYTVTERTKTLSELVRRQGLRNIDLIKLDVQGAEKDVLMGGVDVLLSCKAVILEISLGEYNRGAPQVAEMIVFMDQMGFSMYDIVELHYDEKSQLQQFDAIFVPKQDLK